MADISILKVGDALYSLKDSTARTSAENANTKINGATITGTYSSDTETLEISLVLGTVATNNE